MMNKDVYKKRILSLETTVFCSILNDKMLLYAK